ncbi:MAG: hypothetical protein QOJ50_2896 [Cryptosporangiaceae bacterium]|jgi:hypothetical protein|nr:hypothetical protein [Cryptosporangiaceae bacterium]
MSTSAHSRHLPPQVDSVRIHTTLICLPPASTHQLGLLPDRIAARAAGHTNGVPALVSPNHFTIAANLTGRETALLINPHRSPAGTARCAGGPFGLLDFTEFAALTAAVGTGIHTEWEQAVRGTAPAAPWRAYLDLADIRDHGSVEAAVDDFFAQPRIAAVTAHMETGAVLPDIHEYGAALEAHQDGPASYAAHLAATSLYGDALITEHGDLLAPGLTVRPPIDHTLAERAAYFTAASAYLRGADPNTVVIAAACPL